MTVELRIAHSAVDAPIAVPSDIPTASTSLISSLTVTFLGEGTGSEHVVCSPGWWDGSSALDNSGGDGNQIRTNQAGAMIEVEVTGTTFFGPHFKTSTLFSSLLNGVSKPWRPSPGIWRARVSTDGGTTWGAWRTGLRPQYGSPFNTQGPIINDLSSSATNRIQLEMSHVPYFPGKSITAQYHREVEQYAGQESDQVEIDGFIVESGATFNTIDHSGDTTLHVLVLGDSNSVGSFLVATSNSPGTVQPYSVTEQTLLDAADVRGIGAVWWRQMLDAYATAQSVDRLVISNHSQAGRAFGEITAPNPYTGNDYFRDLFETTTPGYAGDLPKGWNKRTSYVTGSASNWTTVGRDYPATWVPDVVIIPNFTNDSVLSAGVLTASGIPGAPSEIPFDGTPMIASLIAFANDVETTYPNAKQFYVNTQRLDGTDYTTHFSVQQAVTFDFPGFIPQEVATHLVGYIDAAVSIPSGAIHPTVDEHDTLATNALSTFTTMMQATP